MQTEKNTAELESVDLSYLEQLRALQSKGGTDITRAVIQIFLKNAPSLIDAIHHAVQQRDYEAASNLAHKMLSSALNIGARKTAALLKRLESMKAADPQADWQQTCEELEKEFTAVRHILLTKINDG